MQCNDGVARPVVQMNSKPQKSNILGSTDVDRSKREMVYDGSKSFTAAKAYQ